MKKTHSKTLNFIHTKKYLDKNALYITAFLIPFLIMMVIFAVQKIYPFGERSFLHIDMYHQYFPFLTEFYHKLKSGESLSYSWNTGIGNNFLALYAYYLASPFNWLCVLVPEAYLIEFQSYMVVFKIGLCGLTSCYYFRHHLNTKSPLLLFFSSFYALSGFMAAYNWNVMWLDVIFLAPLVIYGLERLVLYDENCRLYGITLALSILSNFYISIMLCIYVVLYFLLVLLPKTQHKITACRNFAFFSLLAGGMAAILWIPEMMALGLTEFSGSSFPTDAKSYFAVLDVLARHCMDVAVEIGLDHWPNIYCGVAVFALVPLYIICKSIPSKEKMGKVILLGFLLISFCTNSLTFLWHGFNYPNSLPCRQSYLYILLLLTICAEAALHLKEFTKEELSAVFFGVVVFLVLCQKLVTDDAFTNRTFLISAIFLLGYAFLLNLYRNPLGHRQIAAQTAGRSCAFHLSEPLTSRTLLFGFLFLFMLEAGLNTYYTSCPTVSRTAYLADYDSYYKLVDRNTTDTAVYSRFERDNKVTTNDGTLYGYPSASHFSSTVNGLVTAFYEKYGLKNSKVYYRFDGATPLTAALLNTSYTISKSADQSNDLQKMVDQEGNLYLYKSNDSLPFGYVVGGEEIDFSEDIIYEEWKASLAEEKENDVEYEPSLYDLTELFVDSDYAKDVVLDEELSDLRTEKIPLETQNALAKKLGATEDIFIKTETENSGSVSIITIPKTGHYYAFSQNSKVTEATASIQPSVTQESAGNNVPISINNNSMENETPVSISSNSEPSTLKFKKMKNRNILDLGFCTAGDVITLTANDDLDLKLVTYRFEEEPFQNLMDNLNNQPFEISSFSSAKIEGTVDVTEAGYMIFSIAYDPGWKITVDGEIMEPQLFEGMFLSVPMTEGIHEIALTYMPQGFITGTIISFLSLGIFVIYCMIDKRKIPN